MARARLIQFFISFDFPNNQANQRCSFNTEVFFTIINFDSLQAHKSMFPLVQRGKRHPNNIRPLLLEAVASSSTGFVTLRRTLKPLEA